MGHEVKGKFGVLDSLSLREHALAGIILRKTTPLREKTYEGYFNLTATENTRI